MTTALASLSVALLLPTVDVPVEVRVENPAGYCTWCSIATQAKLLGVKAAGSIAYEVWEEYGGARGVAGYTHRVIAELEKRGVRYVCQPDGTYDRFTLGTYAETHGVVTTLLPGNPHIIGCHSVLTIKYRDDGVEFWDSSKPRHPDGTPRTWRCSKDWFDRWWSGNAVVVLGER